MESITTRNRARSRQLAENRKAARQFKRRGDRRAFESSVADDVGAPWRRQQGDRDGRRSGADCGGRSCRRSRIAWLAPRAVRRSGTGAETWPAGAGGRTGSGCQGRSKLTCERGSYRDPAARSDEIGTSLNAGVVADNPHHCPLVGKRITYAGTPAGNGIADDLIAVAAMKPVNDGRQNGFVEGKSQQHAANVFHIGHVFGESRRTV